MSGETAVCEYKIESVAYMDRIARVVEPSIGYRHQFPERGVDPTVGQAMSNATCDLAETLGARAIVVPTSTGRTASRVARLRPHQPIIAITPSRTAVSQLALEWGVWPVYVPECADVEELCRARSTPPGRAASSRTATWWSSPPAPRSTPPARRT